jgi:ferritin-like metal-binding protein YciE
MVKAAKSPDLKAAFQKHLAETQGQVKRLQQVFEVLGEKVRKKPCLAMQGLGLPPVFWSTPNGRPQGES